MALQQFSNRIFFLPPEEETDRPLLGYIRGDKLSMCVDCGNSPAHAALFFRELSAHDLHMPHVAAITHWHWDHCYAMSSYPCPVAVSALTQDKLKEMSSWQWTEEAMESRIKSGQDTAFCCDCIRKEYPGLKGVSVKTGDLVFEDKLEINLGGVTARLLRLGGSHSEDSVVVLIPEEEVIFLGDIVCEDLHHGEPRYYKDKLQTLIADLSMLPFTTAFLGHEDAPDTKDGLLSYLKEELSRL